MVTDFVDQHRHELLTLLTKNGDIRRLTINSISTMAHGVQTSREFLERPLSKTDINNLERLAEEVIRNGGKKLNTAIKILLPLLKRTEGVSVSKLMNIKELTKLTGAR